jgi:hypothetical protein
VTLDDTNLADVEGRIDLLIQRANTSFPENGQRECDLVVKGVVDGSARGWLSTSGGTCSGGSNDGTSCVLDGACTGGGTCNYDTARFLPDSRTESPWTKADLLAAATVPGQALTFTCVPPGTGSRMAIDRDRDNFWNFDDPYPDYFTNLDCSVGRITPAGSVGSMLWLLLLGLAARGVTTGRRRRKPR